jgi:hypothetical protein
VLPDAPPLMSELYDRLAEQYPAEWGPASFPGKYSPQFQQDFEKTYSEVVIKEAPRDTLTLLELLRPLALYFCERYANPRSRG